MRNALTNRHLHIQKRDYADSVQRRINFVYSKTGRGRWYYGGFKITGLSVKARTQLFDHLTGNKVSCYVVHCYDTPLAVWTPEKGWWINEQDFPSGHMTDWAVQFQRETVRRVVEEEG